MQPDRTPSAASQDARSAATTFVCPGCGEEEFPDEAGVVTCDECGAHIETLEPLGLRRILPNYWSRLRGSVAAAIPPNDEAKADPKSASPLLVGCLADALDQAWRDYSRLLRERDLVYGELNKALGGNAPKAWDRIKEAMRRV